MARSSLRTLLRAEPLEDRLAPSWGATPPSSIIVPSNPASIALNSSASATGSATISTTEIDYFTFVAPRTGPYLLKSLTPSSSLNTVLGVFNDAGTRVASNNDISGTNTDSQLTTTLTTGQKYYFGVTNLVGTTGKGAYTWTVTGPADDNFEENDSRTAAANLGSVSGAKAYPGLVLNDANDWYRLTTVNTGGPADKATLTFAHSQGDLALQLTDSAGTVLAGSNGKTSTETVSLAGRAAGTYFVRVFGTGGAKNPSYSLNLTAPRPDDSFEDNDTQATASDLGTLKASKSVPALQLNDAADWYKFTTTGTGTSANTASIGFQNAQGNLALQLFSSDGSVLATANSSGDTETVSLAGRPAGTYFVKVSGVSGAFNPNYTLTVSPPADDAFEDNDTQATASDFGTLTGAKTTSGLRMFDAADWYKFTTAGPGLAPHNASIAFAHAQGNLVLQLFNAGGSLLQTSNGVGDAESVSLANRAAGTYFVKVSGAAGATNPSYSLTVNPPVPDDSFEENDTRATAKDLGRVIATKTVTGLVQNDDDWFRFRTADVGTAADSVRIAFTHSKGDLTLALYDSGGALVGESKTLGDTETISLGGVAAGTYFVQVTGALNPSYSLTIQPPPGLPDDIYEDNDFQAEAFDFGTLTADKSATGLIANDDDWYQFTTTDPGTEFDKASITFTNTKGDLDLRLYDTAGVVVRSSEFVFVDSESVSLAGLPAGTYALRVFGFSGAKNPDYSLTIATPDGTGTADDKYEQNDTQATAADLGTLTADLTVSNLVSYDDDWYRFTIDKGGTNVDFATINLVNANGDIDLGLYNAAGELLRFSGDIVDTETVTLAGLSPGEHFLRVFGFAGAINTNYTLTINNPDGSGIADDKYEENDTQATAADFGTLTADLTVSNLVAYDDDWYRFTTTNDATAGDELNLTFVHANGDLDVGLFDAAGNLLKVSQGVVDNESFSIAGLPAGEYFVLVVGFGGAINTNYSLTISAPDGTGVADDKYEQNDTQATAADLGTLTADLTVSGLVSYDDDWYRFTTTQPSTNLDFATLTFVNANGDLDFGLFDSDGTLLFLSATENDGESFGFPGLPAGEYFILVQGFDGAINTDYTLRIDAPDGTGIADDKYEQNDTQATAADLGTLTSAFTGTNLVLYDEDWFSFTTTAEGAVDDEITLSFVHANGDLDFGVYDAAGKLLRFSATEGSPEVVSLGGLAAGEYFIRILGFDGATNTDYTLTIDAPDGVGQGDDKYEENDTFDAAADLGAIAADFTATGLQALDDDWYIFELSAAGAVGSSVSILFTNADGDLDMQLYDAATGQGVGISEGVVDNESISLQDLPAGQYYLYVYGFGGVANDYDLVINI